MVEKVNIVIPAIKIDDELLKCLKEVNKINNEELPDFANHSIAFTSKNNIELKKNLGYF